MEKFQIATLHRYYIWANRMRDHFDKILPKKQFGVNEIQGIDIEIFMYMSFWYAELYVVIEGWRKLKLVDEIVDQLLRSENNIKLLKRYRNAVFHFQRDYYDDRFMDFIKEGDHIVKWVRDLNDHFSRFFLQYFGRIPKDN
ncbi:MAG: hypothetical protein WBB67_04315 [bacterium]